MVLTIVLRSRREEEANIKTANAVKLQSVFFAINVRFIYVSQKNKINL